MDILELLENLRNAASVINPVLSQVDLVTKMCRYIVQAPVSAIFKEFLTRTDFFEAFDRSMAELLVYCNSILTQSLITHITIEYEDYLRYLRKLHL